MKPRKRESRKTPEAALRTQPDRSKLWMYAIGLAVGLFAAFQAYAPALNGPFLFDDLYLPMTAPRAAFEPLWTWTSGVRPLLMFSYWANFQLSGIDTGSYHAW